MTSSQFRDGRQSPSPSALIVTSQTAGQMSLSASASDGGVSRRTSTDADEPSRSSCSAKPAVSRNTRCAGPAAAGLPARLSAEAVRRRYSSGVSRRLVNT